MYVAGADVARPAAVPLVVGRVSATIRAAAPRAMAMAKPTACQTREPVPGCVGWAGVHWPVKGGRFVTPRKGIATAAWAHSSACSGRVDVDERRVATLPPPGETADAPHVRFQA